MFSYHSVLLRCEPDVINGPEMKFVKERLKYIIDEILRLTRTLPNLPSTFEAVLERPVVRLGSGDCGCAGDEPVVLLRTFSRDCAQAIQPSL